jgi:hypothetical protein
MTDDQEKLEETNESVEVQEEPAFFEFKGRRFNDRASLEAFIEGLSFSQGRLAQQKDELERELAPIRKYDLKKPTLDDVTVARRVEELRLNGQEDEAWKLMFEYANQVRLDVQLEKEFDRLLRDSRAFGALDEIDKDIYRDYIKRNYLEQLYQSDNPLQLVETILAPKVSKKAPAKEEPDYTSIGSTRKAAPAKAKAPEPTAPEKGAWDKTLDELGFK